MAEGRGKAQADTLRKARSETMANRLTGSNGQVEKILARSLAPRRSFPAAVRRRLAQNSAELQSGTQLTVNTSALLFPPLVQPRSLVFPLGVITLTFTDPGPEITLLVNRIFN